MKKVFLAILFFCIMQVLAGFGALICLEAFDIPPISLIGSTIMALATVISGVLTVFLCWNVLKMIQFSTAFNASDISWRWALKAIAASAAAIFAGDLLSEMLSLPDVIIDQVISMANTYWGVAAITVIAPVIEEILFREGICGHLLRSGYSPQKAVWISAVLFGLIHFNLAQIPFAILMGLILGVIYVRTGNIVLTSIIHILNNSVSVIQVHVLGEEVKDFSIVKWTGGNFVAGICIIAGFTLCYILLRKSLLPDSKVER